MPAPSFKVCPSCNGPAVQFGKVHCPDGKCSWLVCKRPKPNGSTCDTTFDNTSDKFFKPVKG